MPIWVNAGYPVSNDGRPWKHLDRHCPFLVEREAHGYEVVKKSNVDNLKPLHEHVRRRCPQCFDEGDPLDAPEPEWLEKARLLSPTARAWVYQLDIPAERRAQVGSASDLYARVSARWRATVKGRFAAADGLPFLYNALAEGRGDEVRFSATPYATEAEARVAEAALRRELEAAGWHEGGQR